MPKRIKMGTRFLMLLCVIAYAASSGPRAWGQEKIELLRPAPPTPAAQTIGAATVEKPARPQDLKDGYKELSESTLEARWKFEEDFLARFDQLNVAQKNALGSVLFGKPLSPDAWEFRKAAHKLRLDNPPPRDLIIPYAAPAIVKTELAKLLFLLEHAPPEEPQTFLRSYQPTLLQEQATQVKSLVSHLRPEVRVSLVSELLQENFENYPALDLLRSVLLDGEPPLRVFDLRSRKKPKPSAIGAPMDLNAEADRGVPRVQPAPSVEQDSGVRKMGQSRVAPIQELGTEKVSVQLFQSLMGSRGGLEPVTFAHLKELVGQWSYPEVLGAEVAGLQSIALENLWIAEDPKKNRPFLNREQIFDLLYGVPQISDALLNARRLHLKIVNRILQGKAIGGFLEVDPTDLSDLKERLLNLSDKDFVAYEAMLLADFSTSDDPDFMAVANLIAEKLGAMGSAEGKRQALRRETHAVWVGDKAFWATSIYSGVRGLADLAVFFNQRANNNCSSFMALSFAQLAEKVAHRQLPPGAPKPGWGKRAWGWLGPIVVIPVGTGALTFGAVEAWEYWIDPSNKGSPFIALLELKVLMAAQLLIDLDKALDAATLRPEDVDALDHRFELLSPHLGAISFGSDVVQERPEYQKHHNEVVLERAFEVLEARGRKIARIPAKATVATLRNRLATLKEKVSKK